MCERLAALIAEHREEFRDLIVDELGHTKFLADVYHSVAPTLHWNYYAKLGRNFKFAEVREADLGAAGRQRRRADHEVRDQEPGRARARRRRRGALRVQLPAAGHRAEDGAGAGRRLHRGGQGARPRPAGDVRDGRPDHRGRLPARRAQHRRARRRRRRRTWSATPTWTWSPSPARRRSARRSARPAPSRSSRACSSSAASRRRSSSTTPTWTPSLPTVVGCQRRDEPGRELRLHEPDPGPAVALRRDRGAGSPRRFAAMKVGDPHEDDTVVGPLISEAHRERVRGYVEKAVEEGATVATAARRPSTWTRAGTSSRRCSRTSATT